MLVKSVSPGNGLQGSSTSTSKHASSLPMISPRNVSFSLHPRRSASSTQGADLVLRNDKGEVEDLDSWNTQNKKEVDERLFKAECLNQYMSQYTELDALLMQRKTRSSLPVLTSKSASEYQLKHILKISQRRMEKQTQDQQYKDLAKFSKRHEEDLANKANELQNLYDEVTAQREVLRSKNTKLREQLSEADLAIKAARASASRLETTLKSKMKALRNEDLSYVFSKRSASQVELFTREQEYQEFTHRLSAEIVENSRKAVELDNRVKELRQELKSVNYSQVDHYRKILAEGMDTRSEGLAWAVKALWKLGQKVEVEMFPSFLGLESIHVIIFVAQKSLEIEELTAYLAQIQNSTRLSINSTSHLGHTSDIQERLSSMKKPIKTTRPQITTSKQLFLECEDPVPALEISETATGASQTKLIEERVAGLKSLIQRAQEQELRRVARECFMENLEQRVKTQAKHLLAAIAGAEALSRQMALITKEQKELADELRKAKTFSFSGNG